MARRERLLRIIRIHTGDPILRNEAKVHVLVANFPNLPILNFFSLGIFSLATGNYYWGIMETITAVVGLSLRPYYLNARKLLANLADVNVDSHLSDSLQTSFIIIPSITFLIAEVFSCYTTEPKRGM